MSALIFDARINSEQLSRDVDRVNQQVRGMTDDIREEGNKLDSLFGKIGAGIAAYFAVGNLSEFARKMVEVRGEFQKFEAVLTNTLDGDNVRASSLLEGLSEFAAKTPYQLQDITENFVKLANQGIILTQQELVKLGDFAAVTGKPIGQLFEAIMDINNPERWKEFGTRIQTEGEKVAISFRGQRVEFERTVEGAKNAIAQLGTMKGVEGTMEVISKTLQGQISNFQDAWDRMLNDMGKANEGTFAGLIGGATSLVQNYETVIDSIKVLVATLGAAKAAQIVYNAVLAEQAAVNALVVQSNGFLVASDARAVLWKGRLVAAQQALNKSMLANPYVLAAAGLTALIAGMVMLNKRYQESIDARKKVDEYNKREAEAADQRKAKLDELLTTVRDETKAEGERLQALMSLQTLYPSIFSNLDLHSEKLRDLATVTKEAAEEERKRAINSLRVNLAVLEQQKQKLEAEVKSGNANYSAGMFAQGQYELSGGRRQQELNQVTEQIKLQRQALEDMLKADKDAARQQAKNAEKTISDRIREADSIKKLGELKKEWDAKLDTATTAADRATLRTELDQINAALTKMQGKAIKQEDPVKKIIDDIDAKREAYEQYYIAVRQMGKQWADQEFGILLKQGANFEEYLQRRLEAAKDNVAEIMAVVSAAESAGINLGGIAVPSKMAPIKTTGVTSALDTKTMGTITKPASGAAKTFEKISGLVFGIKKGIGDWDMKDIENASQQTSQFFGEMAYQVRDIDDGLADMLDNLSGVFSSVANIASGNLLQQISGVAGLMGTMYTMAMDTSKIEDRLAKPWEEFERWLSVSNRELQHYIELRDEAIGEGTYTATDAVIEKTRQSISETQQMMNDLKLTWTVEQDGWFGKGAERFSRRVQEIRNSLGGLELTQEGLIRSFGAFGYEKVKGVFSLDLDNLLYDEFGKFSLDRVNELISKGVITDEKVIQAVDSYNQLLKDLNAAEEEKQKLLTATMASNITDSIVEGFRNGERTAEEFADNFEDVMKNALLNVMKVKMLEPQIAKWADDFEQAMSDQLLSDSERQTLKAEWDRIITQNAAYLKGLEDTAGIVTDAVAAADQQGLTGAIKGITEETAGMIAGQMYAIREHMAGIRRFQASDQMDLMNQSVTHLAEIAVNTRHNQKLNSIDDRLKDMNAYLKAQL